MLIGGTGCGKTTLFYHFVSQIKRNMTKDDIMIIFDSKGDFYSKFLTLLSETQNSTLRSPNIRGGLC
jgi:ABC-type lipoprotein export system ATPase subunit